MVGVSWVSYFVLSWSLQVGAKRQAQFMGTCVWLCALGVEVRRYASDGLQDESWLLRPSAVALAVLIGSDYAWL